MIILFSGTAILIKKKERERKEINISFQLSPVESTSKLMVLLTLTTGYSYSIKYDSMKIHHVGKFE
jgi:hypothetical protein